MNGKIIRNNWQKVNDGQYRATILNRKFDPEGLDISRIFLEHNAEFELNPSDGHFLTILQGEILLKGRTYNEQLRLGPFVHLYIPPEEHAFMKATAHSHLVCVTGPEEQAKGEKLIVRNERYLRATADEDRFFRWVLTPQYLSRRIFLYHDQTLYSKSGYPVSWFHTTMFDVMGLPINDDGLPVFKMSYDNQTEPNVCFDVSGAAQVRMAYHPYSDKCQRWGDWQLLDNNTTYYLNEGQNSSKVEWHQDQQTGKLYSRRNKHEVYIPEEGYVSLCCLFDPAPTGIEKHSPGQYSSYENVNNIINTSTYREHLEALLPYDEMLDNLSILEALGKLDKSSKNTLWKQYQVGVANQINLECCLAQELKNQGNGRDKVVSKWIKIPPMQSCKNFSSFNHKLVSI
jgi:hypothetical protein